MLQLKHNIAAVIIQAHSQNALAGFDIFTPDTGVLICVLKSHFNFFDRRRKVSAESRAQIQSQM